MDEARLLATFLDLVRIDSPSGSEAACAEYCARALAECGAEVRYDHSAAATGSDCGNLIAVLAGEAPGVLGLSAHLDCVEPCRGVVPVVSDGIVRSAGETVLGADDKVGLAAIIEAFRYFSESGERHSTLKAVLSVQEEPGLRGAKHLSASDAACGLCLVLDAAGAPGGIVVAAPTHYSLRARFDGRAAHAGVQPEQGVSAIRMAAEAIAAMELGRLDEGTTANVGTVAGGTATNVVAAACELTGECRSIDDDRVEQVRADMERCLRDAADAHGGSVEVTWTREFSGFSANAEDPAVVLVSAACADAGLTPRLYSTGGGSDANILAGLGVRTLALACGMAGVHGTDESVAVEDLSALTRLTIAAARRFAEGELS